ncbi:S8 family serine peptidase [Nocardiopsis kunsanensis]|uniref:S8 family serine peptidase n=1 Tax=Nocardiopsis kunsanensis TaxID=141693 RepID=UPI000362558D|nr:S8 family serine peptidase [Nocardiopsis kunsanensis]
MLGGNSRNRTHTREGIRGIAASCAIVTVLGATAVPAAAQVDDYPDFRPDQWGQDAIGSADLWEQTRGHGVTVAVPGPSVMEDHPDLRDNITVNTEHGDNSGDMELGTALGGLVVGHGHGMDADGGVLGVAPDAGLLALPTEDDMGSAIRTAAQDSQVILLPSTDADLVEDTRAAVASGVVVVGPAGGDEDPNVISVAATDQDGQLTSGTTDTSQIELTAPGDHLYTAGPDMGQTQVTGAPYAAALAAGGIALLRADHPQLTPEQVREVVVQGAQEGPGGLPALDLPTAQEQAAQATEGGRIIDEELAQEIEEGPAVPVWVWFAVVGAVLVFGVLALVMWVRRSSRDPYGVEAERREEDEQIAAARAAEERPARRQKGGRRRKPRKG